MKNQVLPGGEAPSRNFDVVQFAAKYAAVLFLLLLVVAFALL